jgi:hypothetical protein
MTRPPDGIEVTLYAPGVLRLHRYHEGAHVELTCIRDELAACRAWLLAGDLDAPLPVPECDRPAIWKRSYRWTLAASERYLAARGKGAA